MELYLIILVGQLRSVLGIITDFQLEEVSIVQGEYEKYEGYENVLYSTLAEVHSGTVYVLSVRPHLYFDHTFIFYNSIAPRAQFLGTVSSVRTINLF